MLVLTLAAALLAAAPTAPVNPVAADNGSGHPAWGHFMGSSRDSTLMSVASTFVCTLVPVGLAMGAEPGPSCSVCPAVSSARPSRGMLVSRARRWTVMAIVNLAALSCAFGAGWRSSSLRGE